MNSIRKHKKRIARESLIILSIVLISIVSVLWVLPYNLYTQQKIEKLEVKRDGLEQQAEYFQSEIDIWLTNRYDLYQLMKATFKPSQRKKHFSNKDRFWKKVDYLMRTDTLNEIFGNRDSLALNMVRLAGFENVDSLIALIGHAADDDHYNFLVNEKFKLDSRNQLIQKQIDRAQIQKLNMSEAMGIALSIFLSLFFFAYPMRLLYKVFMWSIKAIRN